jgi:protein involved in polysaccharide export with SLBB domain
MSRLKILRCFLLMVNIRCIKKPEMVTMAEQFKYTGKYVLCPVKDRVYDVIQRAGGLTSVANVEGNLQYKRPIQAQTN